MTRRQFWESAAFAVGLLFATAILVRLRYEMVFTQKIPFDLWTGESYKIPGLFLDTLSLVVMSVLGVVGFTWLVNVVRKRRHANQGKGKSENGK